MPSKKKENETKQNEERNPIHNYQFSLTGTKYKVNASKNITSNFFYLFKKIC